MRLHEFMSGNRDALLAICIDKIRMGSPEDTADVLSDGLFLFLDEVVRALRREDGLPELSPLPGRSETAVSHGRRRLRQGRAIAALARDFGSISVAVGELGGE